MIDNMIKRIMELDKLDNEARADMLSELIVESAKIESDPVRSGWDEAHKIKFLWSCCWGVKDNHKRLRKCVDRPKRDSGKEQAQVVMLDLDVSWDECDKGRWDVDDHMGVEDIWTDLGRVCKDGIDAKIIGGRSEGFCNRVIGEQLGMSEVAIGKRLNEMKDRLRKIDRYRYAAI